MRRHLTVAIAGAVLLGSAMRAQGVFFTFDDPAVLDQLEVLTDRGGARWTVEDGVLRIRTDPAGSAVSVRAVRGLQILQGSISFRVRVVGLTRWAFADIGAVFRLQPEPSPDGYPGQYVYLSQMESNGFESSMRWDARTLWEWDVPKPGAPVVPVGGAVRQEHLCCGGGLVELPFRRGRSDKWVRVVITLDREGRHEVHVDLGGGLEPAISVDDLLDRPLTVKKGGGTVTRPIGDIIKDGHPMFGVGGVGIYARMQGGPDQFQKELDDQLYLELDDFEVRGWLAVPDSSSLVTTWARLKRP